MLSDEKGGSQFHQLFTLVVGTNGAIAFAAMVLILEDPRPFTTKNDVFLTPAQSFDALVLLLALLIILSVVSSFCEMFAATGMVGVGGPVATFGLVSGALSLFGLLLAVVVIVIDFTWIGSTILAGIFVTLMILFGYAFRKERKTTGR